MSFLYTFMKYGGENNMFLKKILISILIILLVGCSAQPTTPDIPDDTPPTEQVDPGLDDPTNNPDDIIIPDPNDTSLSNTQLNSIAMLNYLTVVSEQINQSPNSRLYLESVYNTLMNNLYPNAVDAKTQERVKDMFNSIHNLRMIDVKRERLAYLYEQNKANAIASAVPSPLDVLNIVESENLLKAIVSVVNLAVDSYTSYQTENNSVELSYLEEGWALDDEMEDALNDQRVQAWDYMQTVVRENDLEGDLALSNDAVNEFVRWVNNDNVTRTIQWLEGNEKVYSAYGGYWLLLAENYYKNGAYDRCIEATDKYIKLQPRIFRKNVSLAKVLPMAISSAEEVMSGADLVKKISSYNELLINNCNSADWELRYFAALTYLDLYSKTENTEYLNKSYNAVKENVNLLIDKQLEMNKKYLADVQKEEVPEGSSKEQKKEIENYNKMLKEVRKTELPPVDYALLLNTELMLSLAKETNYSIDSAATIDKILHDNANNLFLVDSIDRELWASREKSISFKAEFDGKTLEVSANCVCDDSTIIVTVKSGNEETVITDFKIDSVDRKKKTAVNEFMASFTSSDIKNIKYHDGDTVIVSIRPYKDMFETLEASFTVKEKKIAVITTYEFVLNN